MEYFPSLTNIPRKNETMQSIIGSDLLASCNKDLTISKMRSERNPTLEHCTPVIILDRTLKLAIFLNNFLPLLKNSVLNPVGDNSDLFSYVRECLGKPIASAYGKMNLELDCITRTRREIPFY